MKPRATRFDLSHMRWILPWIVTSAGLGLAGCVVQSTYDKQVAETAELRETLAQAQAEAAELLKQVQALQASNRELDTTTETLRAAIQREEEATAVLRQRAQDRLATLQTQVASLVNQGRILGRDIAEAKQQNASLRASLAQLRRELEEQQAQAAQVTAVPAAPSALNAGTASNTLQLPPTSQGTSPQQASQAPPPAPQPPVSSPPKAEPPPADESWTGWLLSWLSSLWSWIFN